MYIYVHVLFFKITYIYIYLYDIYFSKIKSREYISYFGRRGSALFEILKLRHVTRPLPVINDMAFQLPRIPPTTPPNDTSNRIISFEFER